MLISSLPLFYIFHYSSPAKMKWQIKSAVKKTPNAFPQADQARIKENFCPGGINTTNLEANSLAVFWGLTKPPRMVVEASGAVIGGDKIQAKYARTESKIRYLQYHFQKTHIFHQITRMVGEKI